MIHLVTAADEAYAPGLLVTVASALHGLSEVEEVTLHILDGGLMSASVQKVKSLAAAMHQRSVILFHHVNQEGFKGWRPGPHGSMMTYARLLLGSIIDADKVIYLDVDMLVIGNLQEVWETPMNGMMALGCYDGRISKLGDDSPLPLSTEEKECRYVNAGFLLLDLQQWRAEKMEEQALSLVNNESVVYRWWDQTMLNYLLRYRLGFLPHVWNWQERTISVSDAALVKLIHFKAQKPWFLWSGDLRFRLWRSFYQKFIGSTLMLFLRTRQYQGLLYGIFETSVRRHRIVHYFYSCFLEGISFFQHEQSALDKLQEKKEYYTKGLGGKKGMAEFQKKQPALKKLLQRMNLAVEDGR